MAVSKLTLPDVAASARSLFPAIRARAVEAERDRHIPDDSVRDYVDAGLVRTLVPKRWGGNELPFSTALDVAIEIGRACGSTGWVMSYYTDHAYLVALYPEQAQRDVWSAGPDAKISTSFVPTGKVTTVDGGYRLRGRYPWASGVRHADWMIAGGLIHGGDHPEFRLFLIPRSDYSIVDVWHNAGLSATGSDDVVFDDVFVPEHRSVVMETMREGRSPGAAVNAHPMYAVPLVGIAAYAILGPAIGIARGGVEAWTEFARKKVHSYTREQMAASVTLQIRLAEIDADIDAAELLVRRAIGIVETWQPLSLEMRVRNRRDFTRALRMLASAMDRLLLAGGASGLLESSPVQRAWRDVNAISTHVAVNFEAAGENYGRMALGLPLNPNDPFF